MLSWIYKSVIAQAIVPPALNIAIGVFASTQAAEIMDGNVLVWSTVLYSRSIYVLLALLVASSAYQFLSSRHLLTLTRAFDARRQHGRVRDLTTDAMAQQMEEVIRTGRPSGVVTLEHVKQMWGLDQ